MTIKERWASFVAKLKGARRSLTIAFNAVAGLVLYNLQAVADVLTSSQALLSPEDYRRAAWVIVGINIVLRFKTSKGLHEK
ncbi:hypothetical protein [Niveibacterium terrae]|uniref:hypothetical protein n=1 Tax=Niveibacterium terrae TaxID=3373598 RepID=UPI003A902E10